MNRPLTFCQGCMVIRNTPYQFAKEADGRESGNGGVLGKGQIVWVEAALNGTGSNVLAYAEAVGIIQVDERNLFIPEHLTSGGGTSSPDPYNELLSSPS